MKKIFNVKQSSIFMQNGCQAIDCGFGERDKVWIGFKEDKIFYEMMTKWLNKEFN